MKCITDQTDPCGRRLSSSQALKNRGHQKLTNERGKKGELNRGANREGGADLVGLGGSRPLFALACSGRGDPTDKEKKHSDVRN